MSLFLSRPLIINPSNNPFELPNMLLESPSMIDGPPSPVAHTAAQCELGRIITHVPASMGGTLDAAKAEALKADIQEWIASLPPAYQEMDPDTQWDEDHIYVPLQRHQLHAIGYMTMLLPFKSFLTQTFTSESSDMDRTRRETAIDTTLHLMEVSHRLFDHVFPVNAKFHLVTFLVFDTASFLCSAMIHDKDKSLPQRESVIQAIGLGCSLMGRLIGLTKTAAICYPVLTKLAKGCLASSRNAENLDEFDEGINSLGSDLSNPPPDLGVLSSSDPDYPESMSSLFDSVTSEMFQPASLELPMSGLETLPISGVGDFSDLDVGQFDQIWDWQNLDLTMLPSVP